MDRLSCIDLNSHSAHWSPGVRIFSTPAHFPFTCFLSARPHFRNTYWFKGILPLFSVLSTPSSFFQVRLKRSDTYFIRTAAAAKPLQLCPTLCDPIDGSPQGSPVPEILQARTLEWVAISFSNAWKLKVKVKLLSRVQLLATPWTAAYQAPPSMGFSRQEYWSGVPLPSPFLSLINCINQNKKFYVWNS